MGMSPLNFNNLVPAYQLFLMHLMRIYKGIFNEMKVLNNRIDSMTFCYLSRDEDKKRCREVCRRHYFNGSFFIDNEDFAKCD